MGDKQTLSGLLGSYDNLHEEVPFVNKRDTILGVTISLTIVAFFCAVLRLWTRSRVLHALWWDDLLAALAMCSVLVGNTMICIGPEHGMGSHFLLLGGLDKMALYLKGFYIANGSYIISTSLVKLALLIQYLRVPMLGRYMRLFVIGLAIFTTLWSVAYAVIAWVPCYPISDYWSLNPAANCWAFASQDPHTFLMTFETHTALNMVLDLVILFVPAVLYFQHDFGEKTRWRFLGLLFLGTLANVASMWRLVTIIQHQAATYPTFDPTWYGPSSIVLAGVEINLAVICASVPVFWPVIEKQGFQIFVTKEVKVTSEIRLSSMDDTEAAIDRQHTDLSHYKAPVRPAMDGSNRSGSLSTMGSGNTTVQYHLGSGNGSEGKLRKQQYDIGHRSRNGSAGHVTNWSNLGGETTVSANTDARRPSRDR